MLAVCPVTSMTEHNLLFYAYAALGAQAVGSVYAGSWGALKVGVRPRKYTRLQGHRHRKRQRS